MACLTLILVFVGPSPLRADDCRKVPNILILFDASGYMKEKERYQKVLEQMRFFEKALPLTADGFFNVGLRHYGLKVGMECENTESILAIQPWDPERFLNAFPRSVSYGVSALSAGLRAAANDVAGVSGKSIIVVVGGGLESCKQDPVKIADQIARNNPDLEIHTVQVGNAQDGSYYLRGIAQRGRGAYMNANEINSPAPWYAWAKQYLVTPCGPPPMSQAAVAPQSLAPVTFDHNSFSVRSKDPQADASNLGSLEQAAQTLKLNPGARLILHGFSDGKGTPEYNLKLSRKRAEAVAHFLVTSYGVQAPQIGIVAHGMTQSVLQDPGTMPERMGRRVEFEFVR